MLQQTALLHAHMMCIQRSQSNLTMLNAIEAVVSLQVRARCRCRVQQLLRCRGCTSLAAAPAARVDDHARDTLYTAARCVLLPAVRCCGAICGAPTAPRALVNGRRYRRHYPYVPTSKGWPDSISTRAGGHEEHGTALHTATAGIYGVQSSPRTNSVT